MKRFILFLALCFPLSVSAADVTSWQFTGGQVEQGWQTQGDLQVSATLQGLHIVAVGEGTLAHSAPVNHGIETLEITYIAPRGMEIKILTETIINGKKVVAGLPFFFEASASPTTVDIDLTGIRNWDPATTIFGLSFPAGGEVLLQRIALKEYATTEKIIEGWKSFWTFDHFSGRTINFVWGPYMTLNAVGRSSLFDHLPPRAWSANYLYYIFFALVLVGGGAYAVYGRAWRRALIVVAALFFLAWVSYDIRMGSEWLSFAKADYDTYWSRDGLERNFRAHGIFPEIADRVSPYLEGKDRYAFVSDYANPLIPLMTYRTYPALAYEDPKTEGIDTWVIYSKPDITVDEEGRLVRGEEVLSGTGRIIERFTPDTYLFTTAL